MFGNVREDLIILLIYNKIPPPNRLQQRIGYVRRLVTYYKILHFKGTLFFLFHKNIRNKIIALYKSFTILNFEFLILYVTLSYD